MTRLFEAVTGDIDDVRIVYLDGVADLTTVTAITAHVQRPGEVATVLTAAVTDPVLREVTIQLGDVAGWLATLAQPPKYQLEVQATFADGSRYTWPLVELPVRAQLA